MVKTLSIIIPIFNAETYLEECLESVIGQALDSIEVICVDDGSTDKSLSILEKWQSKDNRIIILRQSNKGPSAARNKGINAAQGEYMTFVDADDLVCKDIYTSSIQKMQENALDVFFFAFESFPNGNIHTTHFPTSTVMDHQQLFASNGHIQSENALCFNWRVVFRSDIIKYNHILFDERIRYGEDMLFNIDAVCHSKRIMVSNKPLYLYRKNIQGAMSKPFKPHLEDSLTKAYDIKMAQIEKYGLDNTPLYRDDIATYYIKEFLPMLINNERNRPVQKDLRKAIYHILSLKMIRDSFQHLGFRKIDTTWKGYVLYLAMKFKMARVVAHIYER